MVAKQNDINNQLNRLYLEAHEQIDQAALADLGAMLVSEVRQMLQRGRTRYSVETQDRLRRAVRAAMEAAN